MTLALHRSALSLMAAAASAPFFLFTLPAGAVADIVNRRAMIVGAVLWQGACSVLLAFGAWTDVISPSAVLACIFALGIGLAFSAPVWGAIVPDIVSKEELPSAVTLGGVQLNLSGIVGPALGGLLLPLLGAPLLISINALDISSGGSCRVAVETARNAFDQAPRKLHRIVHQFAALRA